MPETFASTSPLPAVLPAVERRSDTSHVEMLQRAAIGPVHIDYYLPILARFESYGRGSPSWNWAASLCTLNWMLFRGLWMAALAYVGALLLAAAALVALTRFGTPVAASIRWSLWAALATLAFLLPGLFGNIWLFANYRHRLVRALGSTPTLREACQLLARQSSSRQRLVALAVANAVLALLAAGLWWAATTHGRTPTTAGTPPPAATALPIEAPASSPAADDTAVAAARPAAPQDSPSAPGAAPATAAAGTPAVANAAAASSAPIATTAAAIAPSSATPAPARAPAPAPEPALASAPSPASSPAPTTAPGNALAAASDVARVQAAIAAHSREAHRAPPPPPHVPAAQSPPPQQPLAAAQAAPAPRAPAAVRSAAPASTGGARFQINVGLFAQEDNARRAHARLLQAGLPAQMQELQTRQGKRFRVRAGPFASRAQADAAARQIRALQLEAVVVVVR